jgi:hypothetical protein
MYGDVEAALPILTVGTHPTHPLATLPPSQPSRFLCFARTPWPTMFVCVCNFSDRPLSSSHVCDTLHTRTHAHTHARRQTRRISRFPLPFYERERNLTCRTPSAHCAPLPPAPYSFIHILSCISLLHSAICAHTARFARYCLPHNKLECQNTSYLSLSFRLLTTEELITNLLSPTVPTACSTTPVSVDTRHSDIYRLGEPRHLPLIAARAHTHTHTHTSVTS